jgi:hypothetical protein
MRDELCEHADNSAGAGYVHEGSVEAMKVTIEKLTFDGFALSHRPGAMAYWGSVRVKIIEAVAVLFADRGVNGEWSKRILQMWLISSEENTSKIKPHGRSGVGE